jgi:hypothetical protein
MSPHQGGEPGQHPYWLSHLHRQHVTLKRRVQTSSWTAKKTMTGRLCGARV